jgi:imidazolonepropionase-like amidohydrolase
MDYMKGGCETMRRIHGWTIGWVAALAMMAWPAGAQEGPRGLRGAPDRRPDEGRGPFERLILQGGMLIDGTGGPPRGPVDIVIEGNRITAIRNSGPGERGGRGGQGRGRGARRSEGAVEQAEPAEVLDVRGKYVMPGFINIHTHAGQGKAPETEYVYKLWMAHGITTIRGVALGPNDWTLNEQARSARNEIVAPRIVNFQRPPAVIDTPEAARESVRRLAREGVEGLKLNSYRPEIMAALLDEANKNAMGSVAHLSQMGVAQMNAIDAARLGLRDVTHFYGIFEALYKDNDVQPWPVEMNYNDEQFRFGQVARQWNLIHPKGSPEWDALLKEFKQLGTILDPTMTAYLAGRDVMRERTADWHDKYTLPSMWEFFTPNRSNHGSYFYNWTTWDEVAWKKFYQVWMEFIDDYNDMGGRLTVSDDAAFIYSLWGFAYIEEMELFQEAGLHPLEVIRSATMYPAQAIFEPKGKPIEYGVVREGLLADLCVVGENPIANLKYLYGTGTPRLNDETGEVEWVGGIEYTIKDGIVYDAKKMLADVAAMVQKAKSALIEGGD